MSTFQFEDESNVDRLIGTLHVPTGTTGQVLTVNADKSISPAPGGSVPTSGDYSGNAVTIADNGSDVLLWNTLNAGSALLDITTPNDPHFITAGAYVVQALVFASALTAAGFAIAQIGTNGTVSTSATGVMRASETESFNQPWVYVIAAAVAAAGDALSISVNSKDGAAPRDFSIFEAQVVKVG